MSKCALKWAVAIEGAQLPRNPVQEQWTKATREATDLAPGILGLLLWQDVQLVKAGFPAMSPWWRWTLETFYASLKRWLVVRVGRGGGKSTTLTRVAACENMFGERKVPPGQRWTWPFISVSTEDARRRIVELQAILRAVGVAVEPKYPSGHPTIELTDARGNDVAFTALASTIAGVSGPSTSGATIDEEAKLRDRATGANPSTEILASLIQTFRARQGIRAIRCSSAWTDKGSHALSIGDGDTMANHVAVIGEAFLDIVLEGLEEVAQWEIERKRDTAAAAEVRAYAATLTAASPNIPTWLANPTISAVASREEVEAMPKEVFGGASRAAYWLRENASLPMPEAAMEDVTRVNQTTGLAEANAQLLDAIGRGGRGGLIRVAGLPAWDPRSMRHGMGGGRGRRMM